MRGHGKSDMRSSRRDFLAFSRLLFMGASALVLCPLSLNADNIEALDLETIDPSTGLLLAQVCRLLFPHENLQESVYLDVVRDIDANIAANDPTGTLFKQAASILNREIGGDWINATVAQQLAVLESQQQSEWFNYLRERTIESLYRNPLVWKLVGYQGSSIEHGGYLHRGFADIDWL